MKTFNRFLLGIALCVGLACAAPVARAQQNTNLVTAITYVAVSATSNAASTAYVSCKNHQEVGVSVRGNLNAAPGTSATQTFLFALASGSPTNYATTNLGQFTLTTVPSGTSTFNVFSNIYVGSFDYLVFLSSQNASTNGVQTNLVVNCRFKDKRNGL